MHWLLCFLFVASSAVVSMAADEPSETDLAGITYFAPVCPFYYRMMGPDGELREFRQLDEWDFSGPRGWSAETVDGKVVVRAPGHRRFTYASTARNDIPSPIRSSRHTAASWLRYGESSRSI